VRDWLVSGYCVQAITQGRMPARTRSEISLRGKEERQKSESCRHVDHVTLSETNNQLQQSDYQLVIRVNLRGPRHGRLECA
jgi:hypothetical protein